MKIVIKDEKNAYAFLELCRLIVLILEENKRFKRLII